MASGGHPWLGCSSASSLKPPGWGAEGGLEAGCASHISVSAQERRPLKVWCGGNTPGHFLQGGL